MSSAPIVAPQFIPWLRTGLASSITVEAVDGLAPGETATVTASVRLRSSGPTGDEVDVVHGPPIELLGPAAVVALDAAQVVRVDPAPGSSDMETNLFAAVELAGADLPWRFTPAAVAAGDDRLQPWLVLVVVPARPGVVLGGGDSGRQTLTVDSPDTELANLADSWAWAHVQGDIDLADPSPAGVAAAYAATPERFRARLMCPRRLTPNTSWIAALVPSFEAGRAAGLGVPPRPGRTLAWLAGDRDLTLPVYYSWRFSTSAAGDFESLVRRLTPRELPAEVGRRTIDLSSSGGGLPADPAAATTFVGALVSPQRPPREPPNAGLRRIEAELPGLLNATITAGVTTVPYEWSTADPVVGPHRYVATQAAESVVPAVGDEPVWFGELNVQPHHRAGAGLGARIVRQDQEALLAAAWTQCQSLRPVNDLLRTARVAWEAAAPLATRVSALADEDLVQLAAPAADRLRLAGGTLRQTSGLLGVPGGLLSGAFRRICASTPSLVARRATGERRVLTASVTAQCLADPPAFVSWTTSLDVSGADVYQPATTQAPDLAVGGVHRPTTGVRRQVARPARPEVAARVSTSGPIGGGPIGGGPVVVGIPTSTVPLATQVRAALDPQATVVAMVETRITGLDPARAHPVPQRLTAAPRFSTPMYARLARLDPEYVLPGVSDIPADTVGVLAINDAFVEAYLAGLNDEIGREFLWREYPTPLDATWFDRFWDTVDGSADITEIASWTRGSRLGRHRPHGAPATGLVLLVTGTLLRRYPDTKITLVEATWTAEGRREDRTAGADVRLPTFSGALGAGVRFFGFDIEIDRARGSAERSEHPGYFFAFEEQPDEPRFGLDQPARPQRGTIPGSWSELSWAHLVPTRTGEVPTFVDLAAATTLTGVSRSGHGGRDRWADNAAAMARITLQTPVRMLVHADSMLAVG